MKDSSNYYFQKYSATNEESEQPASQDSNAGGKEESKEVSIFGIKISYSKAFGIVFLILFILLFFPGIGVSSSAVKEKGTAGEGKNNPGTK